jgi:hypothetical protein
MTGIIRINLGTPPKGFKGDFLNITELENGEYRLYLSNGISCGEVKFKLSQSGYRREFMCINNCSN